MAAVINKQTFDEWTAAVERGDWAKATTFLAGDITVNGDATLGEAYIQELKAENMNGSRREIIIVDEETGDIAARFVNLPTTKALDASEEWTEQTLYSFNDGKISSIQSLQGANIKELKSENSPAHHDSAAQDTNQTDLRLLYTEYIDSINALTMDKHFGSFCHDAVTHNYHTYQRDAYREMIESSFEEIKGLHFTIERLIVDTGKQRVAARLGFTGVPSKEFRGIPPTGNSVRFSEHAFYQFQQGRIKQVWSLLDLEAYKRSVGS